MSHASTIVRANQAIQDRQKNRQPKAPPSRRAIEIYKRVVIRRERQCDVAEDEHVTPSRISHICRRVRRWFAEGSPGDPELLAHGERLRLERCQAKDRHEAILDLAMQELAHLAKHPKQRTTRVEEGQSTKVITTLRDQPQSAQVLKVAQRAIAELQKLGDLEPLPEPPRAMPSDNELFVAIFNVLCDWRRRAEHAGRVTKSCNVPRLIRHFMASILGRNDGYGIADDPAVREIVHSLAIGTLRGVERSEAEQIVAEIEASAERETRRAEQGTSSTSSALTDPVALAQELVPPPGGDEIPNPLLFLGPDESLPPAPPETPLPLGEGGSSGQADETGESLQFDAACTVCEAQPSTPQRDGGVFHSPAANSTQPTPTHHAPPSSRQRDTLAQAPSSSAAAQLSAGTTPASAATSACSPPNGDPKSPGVPREKTEKLTTPSLPPPIRVLLPAALVPSPSP